VLAVVFLGPGSLEGVSVTLSPQAIDSPHSSRVGHPARDGTVWFRDVPSGSWWLDVSGPGAASRRRDLVVPWRREGNYRQVVVLGSATLRGRLFDRGGEPVVHRLVTMSAQGDWTSYGSFAAVTTRTDREGAYRFEALRSGPYVLTASLQGDSSLGDHRIEAVELAPGEDRVLDLGEPRADPLWRGRVTLASGTPLRGGPIGSPPWDWLRFEVVRPGSGSTTFVPLDVEGRVAHRVPRGTWRARLWVVDHWFETDLVVGDADFERDLVVPGVSVRGVVREERSRRPIEGLEWVRIEPLDPDRDGSAGEAALRTGAGGVFSFDGVLPGRYRVVAVANHLRDRPSAKVEVVVLDSRDVEGLVIDLPLE
jgi:hypothetical protein